MKKRIVGIDAARAIAVVGMIVVNFKVVLGSEGVAWLKGLGSVFDGKAAATFVLLAGLGLALTTKSAIAQQDVSKLKSARYTILKRAAFLFVLGLSYIVIWPADILHFYGVYMLITLLLLTSRPALILGTAIGLIFLFPLLLFILDYETSWNFQTLAYQGFWTIKGFFRNLFFNGFHPVIPWAAFMLFGYWLGLQDLYNDGFVKRLFWISVLVFVGIQVLSYLMILILSGGDEATAKLLDTVIGTSPMPPLPIYMFNGVSIAFTIIAACILLAKRFENSMIIKLLIHTGQLALTFYVAHVIIGMGSLEVLSPSTLGSYSIEFSLLYALGFSVCCMLFAVIWKKYQKSVPLEWLMRKLTG